MVNIVISEQDIAVLRLAADSKIWSQAGEWRTEDAYIVSWRIGRLQRAGYVEEAIPPPHSARIIAIPTSKGYRLINDMKTAEIRDEIMRINDRVCMACGAPGPADELCDACAGSVREIGDGGDQP